jgi:integrase
MGNSPEKEVFMATTEPIRNKREVRQLAEHYRTRGQLRNYVLVVLGVHTALRISDLLRLRWDDVYDFENCRIRTSVTITEKKTRKPRHSLFIIIGFGFHRLAEYIYNHTLSFGQAYRFPR